MKKRIEIEIEIPKGFKFEAYRPPKIGEHYLHPVDNTVKTVLHDDVPMVHSFAVLIKDKPVIRCFELIDPCGNATPGDNYSKLISGPIKQWCFNSTSAAFFYIWKEVKQIDETEEPTKGEEYGN